MKKLASIILAAMIMSCAFAGMVNAAQEESNSAKFWRGLFQWPFNAAKDSAQVVGDTGKKAVDTVADEGKAIGGTITGQEGAAKDLVTNPVTGTVDTIKTGVVGTGEMPGKATEESWPAEKQ